MIISTKLKLAILLTLTVLTLSTPETAFWLLEKLIVGLFEVLEGLLDEIIEHLFQTSRHTTQMVVFYLMWGMFLFGAYRLIFYLKNLYTVVKIKFLHWWVQKNEYASIKWQKLPKRKKSN